VQNDINNEFSESTIVALMTTHDFSQVYPTHVEVSPRESGLDEPSTILLEQLMTVSVERLGEPVGFIGPSTMEEVDRALHKSLGLLGCPVSR
jgi:mRNA interferase MazF